LVVERKEKKKKKKNIKRIKKKKGGGGGKGKVHASSIISSIVKYKNLRNMF